MAFFVCRPICKHLVLANKAKVYYGLMKEPDINIPLDDDDGDAEGEDKPKVRGTCFLCRYCLLYKILLLPSF